MINPRSYSFLGLVLLLLVGSACQSPETTPSDTDTVEPSNEFPVGTTSQAARAAFDAGIALLDLSNDQKARAQLTKAIELDPDFVGAYLYRSYTAHSVEEFMADLNAAKAKLEKATDGERLLAELLTTWTTGEEEKGLQVAREMVAKFPAVPRAHLILGNQYLRGKDVAAARAAFQEALDVNPNYYAAHRTLGTNYLFDEPKDYRLATRHFQKLIALEPANPDGYTRLGDCYRGQNKLEDALAQYQKATKVDPNNWLTYQFIGHTNSFLGNGNAARANYREAVRLDPNKGATPLRFSALSYIYEGNPQAAMKALLDNVNKMEAIGVPASQLVQAKTANLDSYAWIAYHTGDTEHLKEAITQAKPLWRTIADDVATEEANRNYTSGVLFWESLLALTQNDPTTAAAKAEMMKTVLEPSKETDKLDGYHFLMGSVAMKKGNFEEAVRQLAETPDDWMYAQYQLARAEQAAGNGEAAVALYQKLAFHNFNDVGYALVRKDLIDRLGPT